VNADCCKLALYAECRYAECHGALKRSSLFRQVVSDKEEKSFRKFSFACPWSHQKPISILSEKKTIDIMH
jgi:hypothetical protein